MAIANCENCKKDFVPHRSGKGRFCSLVCYRINMVGKSHGHKTRNGMEPWNKGEKQPNILSWKEFPELRYKINNGITLCHFHHPRKRNDEIKLSPYFQGLVENKVVN